MLEFIAKKQNLVEPQKLADLGLKLSWQAHQGRLHPVIKTKSGEKIKSLFPDWKIGDPIRILLGPMTAKPFAVTTDQMMENGKLNLAARQVIAANAHQGDTTQFEIMREWLEPELARGFAEWSTPGEDGEKYSRNAKENEAVITDPENTKFYSAMGPINPKYGDGIKLRTNIATSNPDSDRGLDKRSKDNMQHLPQDEQDIIKEALEAENYTKRYQPMEISFSDNTWFDPSKLRSGAIIAAIYDIFPCQTRSKQKGKKVSGGTVGRRCTKVFVFANGPSDSFGAVGRGLADFFTVDEPEPEPLSDSRKRKLDSEQESEPEPEHTSDSRKRKLEALAAKKRIKAKRAAENDDH